MSRKARIIINAPADRGRALRWVTQAGWGTTVEFKEAGRSLSQNDALHGLIAQVLRQRPVHNGQAMDMALWKATFLQALGTELRMVPTLDGDGWFPMGLSTSQLSKARFSELIELILAWTAREGLTIRHFDEAEAA